VNFPVHGQEKIEAPATFYSRASMGGVAVAFLPATKFQLVNSISKNGWVAAPGIGTDKYIQRSARPFLHLQRNLSKNKNATFLLTGAEEFNIALDSFVL
jgi:hypothetical protein